MYGTVEEQMAARWAAQKAERVEDLHRRAVARLKNQCYVKGFGQWLETAATRARIMRALRAAGSKLARPKLVAGFAQWSAVRNDAKRERWMLRIGEGLSRNLGPGTRMPHMLALALALVLTLAPTPTLTWVQP